MSKFGPSKRMITGHEYVEMRMRNGEINGGSPITLSNQRLDQLQKGKGEGAESSAEIFGLGTASGTFTFILFDFTM